MKKKFQVGDHVFVEYEDGQLSHSLYLIACIRRDGSCWIQALGGGQLIKADLSVLVKARATPEKR